MVGTSSEGLVNSNLKSVNGNATYNNNTEGADLTSTPAVPQWDALPSMDFNPDFTGSL